jgi:CheY-like chemotaxis protein
MSPPSADHILIVDDDREIRDLLSTSRSARQRP